MLPSQNLLCKKKTKKKHKSLHKTFKCLATSQYPKEHCYVLTGSAEKAL